MAGYNVTHRELPWQLIAEPGDVDLRELLAAQGGWMMEEKIGPLLKLISEKIEQVTREAFERAQKKLQ